MAGEDQGAFLRGVERIFNQGSLTGLSEGELLRRFAAGDENAFQALVTQLGPMVLGVCRRSLDDASDVEDAFQATFLVLLRKAGGLRDPEALSPWLYGVAFRVAARIRARAVRRSAEERKGARLEVVPPDANLEQIELRTMIDEEIDRLPERYRRPVVLCYLEGRTHEAAARRLRCSVGSVRGRLDRARQKLKERLTRRGVAPATALAAFAAGAEVASAAVPAPLVAAMVATLTRAATATAVSGAASAAALELADGVFRAMIVAKLKVATSFLAAAAIILAAGTAWLLVQGGSFAREGRNIAATIKSPAASPFEGLQDLDGDRDGSTIDIRVVDQRTGKPAAGRRTHGEGRQESPSTHDNGRRRSRRDRDPLAVVRIPVGGRPQGGLRPGHALVPDPGSRGGSPRVVYPEDVPGRDGQRRRAGRAGPAGRGGPGRADRLDELVGDPVSPRGHRGTVPRDDRRPGPMAMRGDAGRDRPESGLDRVHAPGLPARELARRPGAGRRTARPADDPAPGTGAGRPGRRSRRPADRREPG